MSHPSLESASIRSPQFKNFDILPDQGVVTAQIEFNFLSGGFNTFRVDVFVTDDNGTTVKKSQFANRSAGSTGGILEINFTGTFLFGGDPPAWVKIRAVLTQTNFNPERKITGGDITTGEIPFTGSFPDTDLPDPKPDQVTTSFSNWTFQNNILNGKVLTNKTNLFPTQFNDKTLNQFIQVKNTSGQTIDLITAPFEFGLNSQVEFNYNNTNVSLSEVNVSLFVWTLDNFPVSLSQTQTFSQIIEPPDPDPIPDPDPTELPSTSFLVAFSNNEPTKFYTLSDAEFLLLKDSIAACASIVEESDTNTVSMGLVFVQNDIIKICQGTEPPLPSNVCFTLLYPDLTEQNFTLTSLEFDDLIANPVSTGICSPIVKNISDCDTESDVLTKVRSNIQIKVLECEAKGQEDEVKLGMVIQSPTGFRIENNRLIGQISYVATDSFNPFWYGKDITSIVQIKDKFGSVIQIKENRLNFTETERDELINIDSSASDKTQLIVDFFVIVSLVDPRRFSEPIELTVTDQGQSDDQNGGGLKFGSGGVLSKVVGGFFGLLTLCLLTNKDRK